jgi:plasmid stabilization system protein ParE
MRVRYTATASRELDEAIGFLREFAPSIAARFADEIDKAIAELVEYPYSAQQTAMEQVRRKYVRRFRYSIFYSVADDEIVILHIRHAARRPPNKT